jgi:hypothetical protein
MPTEKNTLPFVNKCNQQACFVGQALLLLNSVTAAHGNVA